MLKPHSASSFLPTKPTKKNRVGVACGDEYSLGVVYKSRTKRGRAKSARSLSRSGNARVHMCKNISARWRSDAPKVLLAIVLIIVPGSVPAARAVDLCTCANARMLQRKKSSSTCHMFPEILLAVLLLKVCWGVPQFSFSRHVLSICKYAHAQLYMYPCAITHVRMRKNSSS